MVRCPQQDRRCDGARLRRLLDSGPDVGMSAPSPRERPLPVSGARQPSATAEIDGRPSHPPHCNPLPLPDPLFPEDPVRPALPGSHIEDHQMSGVRPGEVHVRRRLLQPLIDGQGAIASKQLAFHDEPAGRSRPGGPDDQQVHPAAAQRIFPLDAAGAVHHPVQERLQDELRPCLPVLRPLNPVLRVFPEELLKGGQQFLDVQASVRIDVPGCLLLHLVLEHPCQFAG